MPEPTTDTYETLCRELAAADAHLVAVSKTHPVAKIRSLYDRGQRDFGENRVSELTEKAAALPDDIRWHFIGHLQRNKVRDVVPHVHLIHSGDSLRLLREVDKRAGEIHRSVDVLLQFHIAEEESKYGLTLKTGRAALDELAATPLPHVRIVGVMGMATYTSDKEQVAAEFQTLRDIFQELQRDYFADDPAFKEISMGMSGDYPLALERGSTMVRVGSLLFGERDYQ